MFIWCTILHCEECREMVDEMVAEMVAEEYAAFSAVMAEFDSPEMAESK